MISLKGPALKLRHVRLLPSRLGGKPMPRRILIVLGHPDPSPHRLCRNLARAYGESAELAGHMVRRVDLAALDFPMLRTLQEFEHGAIPDSLEDAAEAIVWAEHIVFVFPLWLGTVPALLKAFLEQVIRPGTAFTYPGQGWRPAQETASRPLRPRRGHDGHACHPLPAMVPQPRHCRHAAEHSAFRRREPGARNLVRHGRGCHRYDAGEMVRTNAQAR